MHATDADALGGRVAFRMRGGSDVDVGTDADQTGARDVGLDGGLDRHIGPVDAHGDKAPLDRRYRRAGGVRRRGVNRQVDSPRVRPVLDLAIQMRLRRAVGMGVGGRNPNSGDPARDAA